MVNKELEKLRVEEERIETEIDSLYLKLQNNDKEIQKIKNDNKKLDEKIYALEYRLRKKGEAYLERIKKKGLKEYLEAMFYDRCRGVSIFSKYYLVRFFKIISDQTSNCFEIEAEEFEGFEKYLREDLKVDFYTKGWKRREVCGANYTPVVINKIEPKLMDIIRKIDYDKAMSRISTERNIADIREEKRRRY